MDLRVLLVLLFVLSMKAQINEAAVVLPITTIFRRGVS
jgi:hypothetical protein